MSEVLTLETLDKKIGILKDQRRFRGFYRQGSFGPLEKVFLFTGSLLEAKDKFYKHCKSMGYQFIIVRPYEVDLDEQEKMKNEDPNFVDESFGRTKI